MVGGEIFFSMRIRHFIAVVLLPVLLLAGCRYGAHGDGDTQVRLINAVPERAGLNVSVDGQRVWKRALYRSSTGYQGLSAGTYPVRMETAGTGTTLMVRPLRFEKGHRYTVLALGQAAGGGQPAEVEVLDDAAGEKNPEKAVVRLVNASRSPASMDLVVNNIVGLGAVAYGRRSPALLLDGGSYDLTVAAADTPDALLSPVTLRLQAGHVYTLVAMGRAENQSLSLEFYPDTP